MDTGIEKNKSERCSVQVLQRLFYVDFGGTRPSGSEVLDYERERKREEKSG